MGPPSSTAAFAPGPARAPGALAPPIAPAASAPAPAPREGAKNEPFRLASGSVAQDPGRSIGGVSTACVDVAQPRLFEPQAAARQRPAQPPPHKPAHQGASSPPHARRPTRAILCESAHLQVAPLDSLVLVLRRLLRRLQRRHLVLQRRHLARLGRVAAHPVGRAGAGSGPGGGRVWGVRAAGQPGARADCGPGLPRLRGPQAPSRQPGLAPGTAGWARARLAPGMPCQAAGRPAAGSPPARPRLVQRRRRCLPLGKVVLDALHSQQRRLALLERRHDRLRREARSAQAAGVGWGVDEPGVAGGGAAVDPAYWKGGTLRRRKRS